MKMKKIIAFIIALGMIFNAATMSVFAEGEKTAAEKPATEKPAAEKPKDLTLTKADVDRLTRLVQSKIKVPAEYGEFYSELNGNVVRLRWSTQSGFYTTSGGSVDVTVNGNGSILTYNQYKYSRDYDYSKKLPKLSKAEGLTAAKKFIYFLAPDITGQIDFPSGLSTCTLDYEGNYRFSFLRQVHGIPFYENVISVLVDGGTGDIKEYNRNWNESAVFPDAGKAMKAEAAQTAYTKNVPLHLKYRRTYGEDVEKTYLEYSPAVSDLNCSIDAVSGEKITEMGYGNPYIDVGYQSEVYRQEMYESTKDLYLSEQALSDLVKEKGLISSAEAEKQARGMAELGLDETYKLNRSIYSEITSGSGGYLIRLEFSKSLSKEDLGGNIPDEKLKVMIAAGEFGGSMNVTLDARTSELTGLYTNSYYDRGGTPPKLDKKEMEKAAADFLKKYKSRKFSESQLREDNGGISLLMMKYYGGYSSENSLVYTRCKNNIPFEDNQMVIGVDPVTGRINSFSEKWDNIEFVSADKAIGLEKAAAALFKSSPLKLKYVTSPKTGEIALAYGFEPNKPVCLDAEKGILITFFNAEPYKAAGTLRFNDIAKSREKDQIQVLAEAGILQDEESFRPGEAIVQKDWLYLINKATSGYGVSPGSGPMKQKEMDGMYRTLMMNGVIGEEEKDPDAKVLREVGIKYLLNALGYKKFAALEGIFDCSYADKDQINPKLLGYAAIAKALKITPAADTSFRPKGELTRGEAAVLIYNYLKRN